MPRQEHTPKNINDINMAQYRRRARNYENLDRISDKFGKYLEFGGNPKEQ